MDMILKNRFYKVGWSFTLNDSYDRTGKPNHRFNSRHALESLQKDDIIYTIEVDSVSAEYEKLYYIQVLTNVKPYVGWIVVRDVEVASNEITLLE